MLLDPDPHSQYRSGSRGSQINAEPCGSGSTTVTSLIKFHREQLMRMERKMLLVVGFDLGYSLTYR